MSDVDCEQDRRSKAQKKYRFNVGDHVLCRTSQGWEPGRIIMLDYVIEGDPDVHPYQVQLIADGRLIYVPIDADTCCKQNAITWWEEFMLREDICDEESCFALQETSVGKDLHARDHEGDSALHKFLSYGWDAEVRLLLKQRADPNLPGQKHRRLLNMAVFRNNQSMVSKLLDAKADPNLRDEDPERDPNYESKSFEERQWHRSSLHYAVGCSERLTALLLKNHADINQPDAQLKQPLHLAIEAKRFGVVDLLLKSRADVNTGNQSLGLSSTPLHDAAYRDTSDLVRKLIAARSDVNRRGKQGMTPLHMAVRGRNQETVRMLMEAKADVNINVMGQTVAQLARTNCPEVLDCILAYGGTDSQPVDATFDAETRKRLYLD